MPPDELGAPPPGVDGAPLEPTVGCVSGSTLDLVYVDAISIAPWLITTISLAGVAVFANPSEDTVVVSGVSASAVQLPGLNASAAVDGEPAIFTLHPGEAKGALSLSAERVVRPTFSESWADTAQPRLTTDFTLAGDDALKEAGPFDVPVEVRAGDYVFAVTVSLIPDESSASGTPLSAARATAICP